MEILIYKTNLSDFTNELFQSNNPVKIAYVTTLIQRRVQDKNTYVCVVSAFNDFAQAMKLITVVRTVSSHDREANQRAQTQTEKRRKELENFLKSKGVIVRSGILAGSESPVFGTIDEVPHDHEP
jgi:hypothetical protein